MDTATNPPESKLTLPIAIVVAGILIAGAVLLNGKGTPNAGKPSAVTPTETVSVPLSPVTASDYILGNPDAPVTIIEFSDYECPYCKVFHQTMKQIIAEYGKSGKVAWVYRQFPLDQIHPKARPATVGAFCAGSLGGNDAFWKYSDAIFANPSKTGLDLAQLPQFASQIGLNASAFTTCLQSKKFDARIENELQQGLSAGARGTPYSLLIDKNGKQYPINGALPYATVKAMIETVLSNK